MTPMKLNLYFAFFPYGGNGGISNEYPESRRWFVRTVLKARADERIGDILDFDFCDTPITMTRNHAVLKAREAGADILVMCDSDMFPDLYLRNGAPPFFDTSFDFIFDNYAKGPNVVASPYCGPPPNENVYVFKWANRENSRIDVNNISLAQFTREEAAQRAGMEPIAAGPTGLMMFDMRIFKEMKPPWFYYEWTDDYQSQKASTEDVTCTRDLSLIGQETFGYNPLHCNWDCWSGHVKQKIVGKPEPITAMDVNRTYRDALARNMPRNERVAYISGGVKMNGAPV